MMIFCARIEVDDVHAVIDMINEAAVAGGGADTTAVLIEAGGVAGKEHVRSAAVHAMRSFESGRNIARTLSMEVLVYVSGQRQCSVAAGFGLHEGRNEVYVLIMGGDEEGAKECVCRLVEEVGKRDEFVPDVARLKGVFDISDAELGVVGEGRIEELVVERVALVDAWK